MQAVILAAGTSTRTRPLTYTKPKPLLPLLNSTILEHNLRELVGLVDEVVIAEFYLASMIQEKIGDEYLGIKITHKVLEGTPGTGGTISALQDVLKPPFLVINGDDLYFHADLERMVREERAALVYQNSGFMQRLDGWRIEDGKIKGLHHHGDTEPAVWGVATGAYVVGEEYFSLDPVKISTRDETGLPHTLEQTLDTHDYTAVEVREEWIPIGYPWDLIVANRVLLRAMEPTRHSRPDRGARLNGNIAIGKNTQIKAGTYIEGDVYIGDNCTIGPNVYLRDGVVLGDGCRIGQGAEIKNSVLMNDVNMHHFGYIGDSVIGSHVNIGAGTSVGNLRHDNKNWPTVVRGEKIDTGWKKLGAFIGDYSKTAVHTSLLGGSILGPASWTEAGEVVRQLVRPFSMGNRDIPLEKFQKLPEYKEIKTLKERMSKEETP